MEKFIRLDQKGTWRGRDHRSSFAHDPADEENTPWESGVSCYSLKNVGLAVNKLFEYWHDVACMRDVADYEGWQVTIFEGEKVGTGSDWEDTAVCENTLVEADALPFMKAVFYAREHYEDEEITEDEYFAELERIANELLECAVNER